MTRPDYPVGTIIEHRQRFVVLAQRRSEGSGKNPGKLRYRELGPVERVVVGGRWKVYPGFFVCWVARPCNPERLDDARAFDTHAEAFAYADRRAREETR